MVGHIEGNCGIVPAGVGIGIFGGEVDDGAHAIYYVTPVAIVQIGQVAGDEADFWRFGTDCSNGSQLFQPPGFGGLEIQADESWGCAVFCQVAKEFPA